jgi:hypothetical protein
MVGVKNTIDNGTEKVLYIVSSTIATRFYVIDFMKNRVREGLKL